MNGKRPEWLKVKYKVGANYTEVSELLENLNLNTVCHEAACPNVGECFNRRTATFMILGKVCTRACTFCNVSTGNPDDINSAEPGNVAKAVKKLNLKHTVITSVTRDDLSDGGSAHFAQTIRAIRQTSPQTVIEVLIPDFRGNEEALDSVIASGPDIINHNVETIPSLYSEVRPQADYQQSLNLLKSVKLKSSEIYTKSGLMVGLGEKQEDVLDVMKDLRDANCDFLTIGQYLSPSKEHHPVVEWIHPDIFEYYNKTAFEYGFLHASCAPLVRSSYLADEAMENLR